MWSKIKPGLKRWVSRYLVVTMMLSFVFGNSYAGSVLAATEEGKKEAATASDAIRDSRVKLVNKGKEDVQLVLLSDSAGYDAGDSVCLELYIKNNTNQTITHGQLKYSGGKIAEGSAYFEDLSQLYEEESWAEDFEEEDFQLLALEDERFAQTGAEDFGLLALEEERSVQAEPENEPFVLAEPEKDEAALGQPEDMDVRTELSPAEEKGEKKSSEGEEASEQEKTSEGEEEWEEDPEDMDDTPDHLENLVIRPGQSYYVNFYYTIDDEVKGIKSQTINFSFKGKTEEKKNVSAKETFRYTIGALNLLPVEFDGEGPFLTGEEHEMVLDFDIGELQEILEEAELEAIHREEPKEEAEEKEETATVPGGETASPSDGRPASPSQAEGNTPTGEKPSSEKKTSSDGKSGSSGYTGSKASASNGLKATPSNTWAQWGDPDSQAPVKKEDKPLISRLNCQVETYGVKLNGFKIKGFTEEDDVNYGTSVTCKFRVSKNTAPGTYYGKVTASYKYKGRDCKSTQGFRIQVAGEGEVTLKGEVNGTEVIVSGPAEYFPEAEDLEIRVAEADEEQQLQVMEALQKKAEEEGTQIKDYRAFDIKLMAEGAETEPGGMLKVTFKNVKLEAEEVRTAAMMLADQPDGEDAGQEEEAQAQEEGQIQAAEGRQESSIQVYHLDEETVEVNEVDTTAEGNGDVVTAETDHFSVYVVVLEEGAQAYDVTFQHFTGQGDVLESYVKTYRDSWPKDKDGNRVKLGGEGQYRYSKVELDPIVKAVVDTGGYTAKTIKVFAGSFDGQGNAQAGEETEESRNGTYNDIFSKTSENKEIPIKQDTIIRIYYEKVEKDEIIMDGVTFYDYDKGDDGFNSASNYPSDSPTDKRLAVGLSAPWTAMVEAPKPDGTHARNNANSNNSGSGYPIIQGIVTGLDGSGNPIMGNGLVDPGFFTKDTNKAGKHIYPTDEVKTGLQFIRKGENYQLDYAVLDISDKFPIREENIEVGTVATVEREDGRTIVKTQAGQKNINEFFPLDCLVDPEEEDRSNSGPNHNCYFGIRYEFTINVGDYIGPLDYTFSGDDDLWMFLDNRLVLDLGGNHSTYPDRYTDTPWRNHVNLWWYLNHPDAGYEAYDQDPEAKQDRCDLSKTYGTHKITILYMERGAGDSGCAMEFNMPGLKPIQVTPIRGNQKIAVKKVWEDNHNPYQPKEVCVQLRRKSGGGEFENLDQITLNASNNWSYQWQVDMNGYTYDVVEKDIPAGYEAAYSQLSWNEQTKQYEITITNQLKDIQTAKVVKAWQDEEDQDGNRPEAVSMQLYWKKKSDPHAEWKKYEGKKLVLDGREDSATEGSAMQEEAPDQEGHWNGRFTNLPKYMYDEQGSPFEAEYGIFEMNGETGIEENESLPGKINILEPYTVSYQRETGQEEGKNLYTTTVTNRYIPKTVSYKAVKVWNNVPTGISVTAIIGLCKKDGHRYVLLETLPKDLQGKEQENPITFSKKGVNDSVINEHTWSNLPAYDAGSLIEYRICEMEYGENGELSPISEPGMGSWTVAADGYQYKLQYSDSGNSSDIRTTTITNTLQAARLRIKKEVDDGEKEPEAFKDKYKFLIEVRENDTIYTTVALTDGGISEAIVVPFTKDNLSNGKTFGIREIVPMEYTLKGMAAKEFAGQPGEQSGSGASQFTWNWDKASQTGTVTLKPGADVIVTVSNEMKHEGYFHHTAWVTNEKKPTDSSDTKWDVKTAPFVDEKYTESHGNKDSGFGGNAHGEGSNQVTYEVPYVGEERTGFREKVLDEEVALYG